jgi:hypothetical protein
MKRSLLPFLLLLLFLAPLASAECRLSFALSASARSKVLDNRQGQCSHWTLTFTISGVSTGVELQTAANIQGPWAKFTNTPTASESGAITASGSPRYLSVYRTAAGGGLVSGTLVGNNVVPASPAITTRLFVFQGAAPMGVNAWPLTYITTTNMEFGTVNAAHIRSSLVVAAGSTWFANNASGTPEPWSTLGPWTVTPVTTANPKVSFTVEVRSADHVNPGSMALSYACVAAGENVDLPTPIALAPIPLTNIAATKSVYPVEPTTQQVMCSGTPDSPSDLYVWWTPTAPPAPLELLRLSLRY